MTFFDAIYHASALFILILGFFVVANNFNQRNSWIFFFWSVSAVGWMLSLYWGFWLANMAHFAYVLLLFRFAYAFSIALMSLMSIFFYFFPRVTVKVHYLFRFLYAGFTLFMIIAALLPLIQKGIVVENGVYVADTIGPVFSLYTFDILLNFFLALYLAIRKYLDARGIERHKIAVSTFGYFVFVFFAIVTNVVLPFFGIMILWLQELVPILTLIFVIPAYVSLQRYRFFNLSYVSLNLCRRFVLFAIFLLFTWVVFQAITNVWPALNPLIVMGLSILFALYVYGWLEKKIPRFYSEDLRNFLNSLNELKSYLYTCNTLANLQNVLETTFLVKLNYVNAKLYLVRTRKSELEVLTYVKDDFTETLQQYKKDLLVLDELQYQKKTGGNKELLENKLKKLEADICMPLFSGDNLIGFLALRKAENARAYPREEIDEILSMKHGLEIALMNVLLKLNLEEENDLMKVIIQQKTKELKHKIDKINELLEQQSDFIAVTAHEFRTPLSIAIFQLDEIMESNKADKEAIKSLNLIDQSLRNLKELTQKLFAVQQYDLNKVKLYRVQTSIRPLIKEVYLEFAPMMKEKGIDFKLELQKKGVMDAFIDRAQFRQVLHNLLSNAHKFSSSGDKVVIEAFATDTMINFKISDSGEGIPDHLKKVIFEKFRTKSAGAGIGLGLYLCKKIIALHKGKMWVEDSSMGGASFCITLKRAT